jgi:hypothetical protein
MPAARMRNYFCQGSAPIARNQGSPETIIIVITRNLLTGRSANKYLLNIIVDSVEFLDHSERHS